VRIDGNMGSTRHERHSPGGGSGPATGPAGVAGLLLAACLAFGPMPARGGTDVDAGGDGPDSFSVLQRTAGATLPPRGALLFGAGVDYRTGWIQPYSGLGGDLTRLGVWAVEWGFADNTALRVEASVRDRLAVDPDLAAPNPGFTSFSHASDYGVLRLSSRFRFVEERGRRPSAGLRLEVDLPTTDETQGIGLNATDVILTGLWSWTGPRARLLAELGVGIMETPASAAQQNDELVWGLRTERRLSRSLLLTGEVEGHQVTRPHPLPGTESRDSVRAGLAWRAGRVKVEALLTRGLTRIEGGLGAAFGLSWSRPAKRAAAP
jgi:hypothetical protein